jgi:nucleolar protein 14
MAKKGSHLKRFKESISKITKPDHKKKIRKNIPERDPDRAEKLKRIEEQFNAFDTKFTHSKHDVVGRKVKGKTGKPGISRERGEQEVTSIRPTVAYCRGKML